MAYPSYTAIVRDCERASWSLEHVTAGLVDLDFERPFLPEALVHAQRLPFLDTREAILLSQIRVHAYLGLNVLAEKLTLPFVTSQAAASLHDDSERVLALMGHGHRAAKHVALFERFSAALQRGFDVARSVVGPVEDISARFLAYDSLAIGLLVLHFECVTQTHHVRSAGCQAMEPQLKELLRLHWQEESRHTELIGLVLSELARESPHHGRGRAVAAYVKLLDELSAALREQLELDLDMFERVARPLAEDERLEWRREQSSSYHEVFLRQGFAHPIVRRVLDEHFGGGAGELDEAVRTFGRSTIDETA